MRALVSLVASQGREGLRVNAEVISGESDLGCLGIVTQGNLCYSCLLSWGGGNVGASICSIIVYVVESDFRCSMTRVPLSWLSQVLRGECHVLLLIFESLVVWTL